MSGSVFLDTNVLVYAIETGGPRPEKSAAARALVRREDVCLSTQVLGEFYCAVTSRRRAAPLTHDEAIAWIQLWKRHDVREITVPHVDLALELSARYQLSYYDGLVLAAAHLAGCEAVFSEDLSAGQDYAGLRVENPFLPGSAGRSAESASRLRSRRRSACRRGRRSPAAGSPGS